VLVEERGEFFVTLSGLPLGSLCEDTVGSAVASVVVVDSNLELFTDRTVTVIVRVVEEEFTVFEDDVDVLIVEEDAGHVDFDVNGRAGCQRRGSADFGVLGRGHLVWRLDEVKLCRALDGFEGRCGGFVGGSEIVVVADLELSLPRVLELVFTLGEFGNAARVDHGVDRVVLSISDEFDIGIRLVEHRGILEGRIERARVVQVDAVSVAVNDSVCVDTVNVGCLTEDTRDLERLDEDVVSCNLVEFGRIVEDCLEVAAVILLGRSDVSGSFLTGVAFFDVERRRVVTVLTVCVVVVEVRGVRGCRQVVTADVRLAVDSHVKFVPVFVNCPEAVASPWRTSVVRVPEDGDLVAIVVRGIDRDTCCVVRRDVQLNRADRLCVRQGDVSRQDVTAFLGELILGERNRGVEFFELFDSEHASAGGNATVDVDDFSRVVACFEIELAADLCVTVELASSALDLIAIAIVDDGFEVANTGDHVAFADDLDGGVVFIVSVLVGVLCARGRKTEVFELEREGVAFRLTIMTHIGHIDVVSFLVSASVEGSDTAIRSELTLDRAVRKFNFDKFVVVADNCDILSSEGFIALGCILDG